MKPEQRPPHEHPVTERNAPDSLQGELEGAVTAYVRLIERVEKQRILHDRTTRALSDLMAMPLGTEDSGGPRAADSAEQARLRAVLRKLANDFRSSGTSLDGVLRRTGSMLRPLRDTGHLRDEHGRIEAQIMRWVAEEYCRLR